MDKRNVKFAKSGKNVPPSNANFPPITASKPANNAVIGNGNGKLRPEPTPRSSTLPVITVNKEGHQNGAPPSGKSSRNMSAELVPQVGEFLYSKAVEIALRKYGYWSGRPLPKGYRSKYLEADISSLQEIYDDHVFMRKSSITRKSAKFRSDLEDFRPAKPLTRSIAEVSIETPKLMHSSSPGRDTPIPKVIRSSLRSGAVSRFPSIAVEFRVQGKSSKKKPREGASSRVSSVVSCRG